MKSKHPTTLKQRQQRFKEACATSYQSGLNSGRIKRFIRSRKRSKVS